MKSEAHDMAGSTADEKTFFSQKRFRFLQKTFLVPRGDIH
jgi:hypothetical protein